MKIKRKTVLKWIRKSCEHLPEETYTVAHKNYIAPEDTRNILKKDLTPEELFNTFRYLDNHPVNHYRRCKTLYDRFGMLGVQAYFSVRNFTFSNTPAT